MENKKNVRKLNISIVALAMLSVLVLATVFGISNFSQKNQQRILEQNANYAFDTAKQIAVSLNQEMSKAIDIVETYCYFIENNGKSKEVTPEYLKSIEKESGFDLVRYINEDGVNMASDGSTSNAVDRDYYINGIQGMSGISVIFNSRIDNSTMIGFYAPLYNEGEVYGVLRGVYLAKEHLKEMLETTFFDKEVYSYLCDGDGRVIAGTNIEADEEKNISDIAGEAVAEEGAIDKISSALDGEKDGVYTAGLDNTGLFNIACIVKLEADNLYLVQFYPKSITLQMIDKANKSGFFMMLFVGLIILLNVVFFLLNAYRTNFELFVQNRDMGYIIDGISGMIEWFGMVDFEEDSFRFLETNRFVFEKKYCEGEYHRFLRSFLDSVSDPNDEARLAYKFSKDNIDKMLGDGLIDSFGDMFCSKNGGRDQWYRITVTCLETKEEKVTKILFMVQDVTAIREADEQIKRELDNKEKALKLAAKERTEFILGFVEQIDIPRSEIINACERIGAIADDDRDVNQIRKGAYQQGIIMESLCKMADIESGNISISNREYEVAELIDAINEMLDNAVSAEGVTYRVDVTEDMPKALVGDIDHICQAVNNMIISAFNRTKEGGVIIDISSQRVDMDNALLRINCVDSSKKEESEFTTKWGDVSFYISKSLASAMGGQGFVDSRTQEGNTTSIIVPQKVAFD